MRVDIDKEDMLKLSRYGFLMQMNRSRWLFSYENTYLQNFLLYFKLYHTKINKINNKYNLNNQQYTCNFANNFINIKEEK